MPTFRPCYLFVAVGLVWGAGATRSLAQSAPAVSVWKAEGLQILDPGKQPRQTLRYSVSKGAKGALRFESVTDIRTTIVGANSESTMNQSFQLTKNFEVIDVQQNGDILYKFHVVDAESRTLGLLPNEVEALEKVWSRMKKAHGLTLMTSAGGVKYTHLDVNARDTKGFASELTGWLDRMNALIPPLPSKPIGVGAHWEISQLSDMGDIARIKTTSTYHLAEREGNRVVIALLDTRQTLQPFRSRESSKAPVKVVSVQAKGAGRIEIDLAKLQSTIQTRTTMEAELFDSTVTPPRRIKNRYLKTTDIRPAESTPSSP